MATVERAMVTRPTSFTVSMLVTTLTTSLQFSSKNSAEVLQEPAYHGRLKLVHVQGREHTMQRELVDDGEVLANAAVLAGRLEEVEIIAPQTSAQLLRGIEHGLGWTKDSRPLASESTSSYE